MPAASSVLSSRIMATRLGAVALAAAPGKAERRRVGAGRRDQFDDEATQADGVSRGAGRVGGLIVQGSVGEDGYVWRLS